MVAQSSANGESMEQRDLRWTMLQPSGDLRLAYLGQFVRKREDNHSSLESIAEILLNAECWLSDLVGLENARLTKAFLREKDAASNVADASPEVVRSKIARLKARLKTRLKVAFDDVEVSPIDADSRASVDRVMKSLDVINAEVIFKYGPDKEARIKYFFDSLVKMATTRVNPLMLMVFVKPIVGWNILDDAASQLIEREVFGKSCAEVVKIFLDNRVEAHIEKSFKRNPLTALFVNPSVNIAFLRKLKFDVNLEDYRGFTALHYAVQSSLVDKARFLLDYGADANSVNWGKESPLMLTLREPQLHSADNKGCAELLLQHGADPFRRTWGGESFSSRVMHSENAAHGCLVELALAYVRICRSKPNWDGNNAYVLFDIETKARENSELFDFYMRCKEQIRTLKNDRIREDLTMFTVISNTGEKLIRLIDEKDMRAITGFIYKYVTEGTLHAYYLNALQEHMRQWGKLVTCQNKVMLGISERMNKCVRRRKIMNKVKSDLSAKDLLMFQ